MTRRASTALLLCALMLGLSVAGTIDRGPESDSSRVTAYLDAPDVDTDLPGIAPLFVAVLGATAVAAALGPWTTTPTAWSAAPAPVVRRRAPARGPPPC